MQTLLSRGFGFLLLGVLLVFVGMILVLSLTFNSRDVILGLMSILAGALIIAGK